MSPRQVQSDASINLAEIRNFLLCSAMLLDVGVILSLMVRVCAGMMTSSLMSIRLPCVLVTTPRCSINHFQIGKAGLCERKVIRHIWEINEFIYLSKAVTESISQARCECCISLNRAGDLLCMSTITSIPTKFTRQREQTF